MDCVWYENDCERYDCINCPLYEEEHEEDDADD